MKRTFVFAIALALSLPFLTAACGSGDTPNSPSPSGTATFTATLRPSEETPPVTGAEAAGTGTVNITLNTTRDSSGNVTAATATFAVNVNGFPAGMPVNMAHIHQAAVGQSGNVVVNTSLAPGDVTLANGAGSFTRSGIDVTPDLANQILANPAGFYFNIHSTLNPAGVARGQLVRAQ
jgi:hypothetical protein